MKLLASTIQCFDWPYHHRHPEIRASGTVNGTWHTKKET